MKKWIISAFLALTIGSLTAGEGMWIPSLIKQLTIGDMQSKGLKLTADEIYSINQSSLKDAIVHFGGGCTSEIISSDGLLLTNHHCGYGSIQSHSSLENDYLSDGFWAKSAAEELPNNSLTATIIKQIKDVTTSVMEGVSEEMAEEERAKLIAENSRNIIESETADSHYEAYIKPFYYGNEYYLFIVETFKDVRLVGAPPSSIGKYGFDTDNWIWPRHTGDFSLFRIYAGKDNKPAEYSEDNVPYKPGHFLPINLGRVDEDQFTMVYGFPGTTQEYLTSYAVKLIQDLSYPIRIAVRTKKLEVLDKAMAGSDEIRIKYAAKQSSTSNAWKKWQGEIRGLKKFNAINKKENFERRFEDAAAILPPPNDYEGLLTNMEERYKALEPLQIARDYFVESSFYGSDILRYISAYRKMLDDANEGELADSATIEKYMKGVSGFFKNYDLQTDKKIFIALMELYASSEDSPYKPTVFKEIKEGKYKGDIKKMADDLYANSIFVKEEKITKALQNWNEGTASKLYKDPFFQFMRDLYANYFEKIKPSYDAINDEIDQLTRTYMEAQMEVLPDDKRYYPDANGTLRIAYGKVEPYEPRDGVIYTYYTTLEGVIEKYNPEVKEFNLPSRLIELYNDKDYGRYGKDGEMRVCFIASNHTTGGNSGSPVLNEKGELIGLNFDRNWEGTMSDIMYDPSQCRNISVDINYVLFIIDKFADAGYLLKNMDIRE